MNSRNLRARAELDGAQGRPDVEISPGVYRTEMGNRPKARTSSLGRCLRNASAGLTCEPQMPDRVR